MDGPATMWSMNDSMAQHLESPQEAPRWKGVLGWVSALLLAALFLASGLWKVADAQGAAIRMAQARVPEWLSLPAAIGFGIVETVAAVLLLIPRLRQWGAALTGLLLLAFMVYIGINYQALRGAECSCFPWLKRAVGPGFFIGDGIMLGLALAAGIFSPPSKGLRTLAVIAGAVTVFAFISWGVNAVRQTGTRAPATIVVDGHPYSLQQGKILLFFFDPQCMHCFDAAQKLSRLHWGTTRIVGVPSTHPEYARQFMIDTGLNKPISTDHEKLKQTFPYPAVPAAIALENGAQKAALVKFEGEEPETTLKALGFIEF